MREHTVLRVVAQLIIPPILIFALYVQFHGDYSPGGGFQAGVIGASAIILYGLIFGVEAARRAIPPTALRITASLGVLIYGGTGVATMLAGGNFLDYDVLAHDPIHGQHYGLLIVEFGVGVTVASIMIAIFYVFAGRGRVEDRDT
ncbi:Na(+)/H(+) antiporter subunit B [Salinisphaera hydrothermalis]|uniref:Putative monovalent cation/H+ antiporter subunit B n=1 Tax=Salinisphaera hydrothermalis (strain C41B8) TaxID=1304275 RepID=A0A084INU8_SALHC|nr:Na(+)/H(+) antiporter subunit B [Salinisphaera hydrothermalis]KEZ78382.1 putative monovalent cation/H+ antiporter subunit B [Salinisphaera hydrothermalis C41B8]